MKGKVPVDIHVSSRMTCPPDFFALAFVFFCAVAPPTPMRVPQRRGALPIQIRHTGPRRKDPKFYRKSPALSNPKPCTANPKPYNTLSSLYRNPLKTPPIVSIVVPFVGYPNL